MEKQQLEKHINVAMFRLYYTTARKKTHLGDLTLPALVFYKLFLQILKFSLKTLVLLNSLTDI